MINLTEQEFAKIFDEVGNELVAEFNVSALEREFVQRFGVTQLSTADAEKISATVAVITQLNRKFLFRVLAKVLCKPRQDR